MNCTVGVALHCSLHVRSHCGLSAAFLPQEESWREIVFGQLIDRKYLDDKSTRIMAMIDE